MRSSSAISGTGVDQAGESQQCLREGGNIGGGMATVALEETVAADLADHLAGVDVGQRGDAEGDDAEDLDVDAAQSEGDDGAEGGVVIDADHHLGAAADHRLLQDALGRRGGGGGEGRGHALEGGRDRRLVGDVEGDQAVLGLGHQVTRGGRHRHREADLARRRHRLLGALGHGTRGQT